jgi:hypothetical protein
MKTIAINLARILEAQAKAMNADANRDYADAIGTPRECDVWNECKRTARLCELADIGVIDTEDCLFEAAKVITHPHDAEKIG